MVATQKAESKSEETQERVRTMATVTTESGEGMTELGQQISQLMTALTHTGRGSCPLHSPGSPQDRGCGWGHSVRGRSSHQNSCNGRGGPGQMILAHSLPKECGAEGTGNQCSDHGNCKPSVRGCSWSLIPIPSPVL